MVESPPSSVGNVDSMPGERTGIPQAVGRLGLHVWLKSLDTGTIEPVSPGACAQTSVHCSWRGPHTMAITQCNQNFLKRNIMQAKKRFFLFSV